ncbi:FKBP-type peptidyl-prolyl cis-trans isomerase [Gammaproteobacteria bacterium]|nr:FKBP-type peptidyl-prolyl cis-trans isomerase [Gammaproteobacteria bacterium]
MKVNNKIKITILSALLGLAATSISSFAAPDSAQPTSAEAIKKQGKKFLTENKNKKGIVSLPSGLQYEVISEGNGKKPRETDIVTVDYEGKLLNGQIFDSSYKRGQPASFPVNGVISGWTEALQLMNEGSTWKLYIPPQLAYGEAGAGGVIGPNETLIFKVKLLNVK